MTSVGDAVLPTGPPFEPAEPGAVPPPPPTPTGFFFPSISIECAFGSGPLSTPGTWTDIAFWCEAASITRGRQHELQRFEAGTMQLTLRNLDGRFSQWNTASPYYPYLVPSTPIRLTATWNGVAYPIFYGYVDSWIPQYGQSTSQQIIKATDGLNLLALAALDKSVYPDQVLTDGVKAYYQLSDPIGSNTAADSSGNGYTGTDVGSITYGTAGPLLTGNTTAATSVGAYISIPASFGGSSFTVECWVQFGVNASPPEQFMWWSPTGGFVGSALITDVTTGFAEFIVNDQTVIGTTNLCDGAWHHVVGVFDGGLTLYVDGVEQNAASASGSFTPQVSEIAMIDGNIGQVAFYDYAVTNIQVANHYQLGSAGWEIEYSGQRIAAILDVYGWPSGLQNIATGISQVQAATSNLSTTQVLSYIQTIEATEQGAFFIDESGVLTYYDRHYVLTAPAATETNGVFSSDNVSGTYYFLPGSLVPAADDLDLWTDVLASRQTGTDADGTTVDGVNQVATNPTAVDAYGYRTLTGFTGMLQTADTEVLSLAQWLLAHYDTPISRVRSIAVDSTSEAGANFPQMLGRQILDRITVVWKPIDSSTVHFDQDSLIESIQHDITPAYWKTTWGLAPGETQEYLILDSSTQGQLDEFPIAY